MYGKVPACYTNQIRTPRPLYMRLFGSAAQKVHSDEQKMIDEVYAHLSATLGVIDYRGVQYFEDLKIEAQALMKQKGILAAKQYILYKNMHELAIPRFIADHWLSELRS